ncbi:ABC transporter permease/substrate binding protein [Staphylococcus sp. NRL 16/872]|uniref:ABC transporter permease/substrate binding protein n=1 Tax=Staphylococcus sp. NRL 16/872 TaxID=2930131 RepID=UPI001FB20DB8|nr:MULTISPECIES: ABC transporter permease/substrate binding protein [unclassified Staphylococcus]MCJ1657262.1 ABC transporter permease/substrate binding protein [Staphylococcus sp. NRL 21/187]MCJ1662982.1 ABC transporter permease/substrate binding protein [Staphylococcus sp. NRL 18/288]MCJ1669107.1 ABC transporter permease/substrate binding protein [Staphylococcus sp. NRL 19/737]WEN69346.1 ABC transporter permease/substrate binding protein [Staphylococcus sp. NRL 16/872]
MFNFLISKLPFSNWIDNIVDWLTKNLSGLFSFLQTIGNSIMNFMTDILTAIPPFIMIALLVIIAFFVFNRKLGFPIFVLIGLLFIYNQDMWDDLMNTVTLVIISSIIAIIIGVPLGILMSKSDTVEKIVKPLLDLMQTMPGFVYLIPAVAFFGIGMVPGVFASVIFSLPPTVRMTNLGIRSISKELVETSDSFGSTPWQRLFKLDLPMAKENIFAGINQTIMLTLSMVVIASMIGTPGLGEGVLAAVQRSEVGNGFVFGIGIVILAIIIDRFTQAMNRPNKTKLSKKKKLIIGAIIAILAILAIIITLLLPGNAGSSKGTITLAYAQQDDQVVSTNVIAQVLEEQGYNVKMTSLDIPVTWKAVANGEADAMTGAWIPITHKAQYKEYKDDLDNLGPHIDGEAKLGLVVPKYMDVDSIEDLNNQADKKITGIEPGAGIVQATNKTLKSYPNLKGWKQVNSSTGAMNAELKRAIKSKKDIVITGWNPYWIFQRYDLKYLKDPKGTMGKSENINTMARKGLKKDMPEAYKILDNFKWSVDDMESIMLEIENGKNPKDATKEWIDNNHDKVDQWTK